MTSIFLRLERPFDELLAFVNALLGTHAVATKDSQGNRSQSALLDFEVYVVDNHGLEDDREIPFESYDMEIDFRSLAVGESCVEYPSMLVAVARYVAARLSAHFACEARIVTNLQRTLAIYRDGVLMGDG